MCEKENMLVVIFTFFVLTFLAAFWWNRFLLSLMFCTLQVFSSFWLASLYVSDLTSHKCFYWGFISGAAGQVLGVFLLLFPLIGLNLFTFFYTTGTICTLASILWLLDHTGHNTSKRIKAAICDASIQCEKLFDRLKSEVEKRLDSWEWSKHLIENLHSDLGDIVWGLGVLFCPSIVVPLLVGNTLGSLGHQRGQEGQGGNGGLGGLGGLGGGLIGALLGGLLGALAGGFSLFGLGMSALGNAIGQKGVNLGGMGNRGVTRRMQDQRRSSAKKEPHKADHKQQGKPEGMENMRKNMDGVVHQGMKVLGYLTLFFMMWNWGLAILAWLLKCLLWLILKHLNLSPQKVLFILCFFSGAVCTVLGVHLWFLPIFGFFSFSFFYALGNIAMLGSTMFLVEPSVQWECMFDQKRALATSGILACFVLTVLAVFWLNSYILSMTFCILHILSSAWYCLSYIQEGLQDFLKKSFSTK